MTRKSRYWLGVFLGSLTGYALVLFAWWIVSLADANSNLPTLVAYPGVFLIPFSMGVVAAWIWKPLGFSKGQHSKHSLTIWLISSLGAAVVLREGAVCLVIAAPLLWLFIALGAQFGRTWFKYSPDKLNLSIFPLLLLAVAADALHPSEKTTEVTDEILVRASPEKIFPFVVSFPRITTAPTHWLQVAGLPEPVQSTSDGAFVGAKRECIFSNGLVFPERITELVPNEKLTFIVTEQPRDPELLGHFFLHTGQFELCSRVAISLTDVGGL